MNHLELEQGSKSTVKLQKKVKAFNTSLSRGAGKIPDRSGQVRGLSCLTF